MRGDTEEKRAVQHGFAVSKVGDRLVITLPTGRVFHGVSLVSGTDRSAVIHHSTKPGTKLWQVSYFNGPVAAEDAHFDTLQEAFDSARASGLEFDKAS